LIAMDETDITFFKDGLRLDGLAGHHLGKASLGVRLLGLAALDHQFLSLDRPVFCDKSPEA